MISDSMILCAGRSIRRLRAIEPGDGRIVKLTWEDGTIARVDLSKHIAKFKVFAPLLNDDVFRAVVLGEWGLDIDWPTAPGAAIPSSLLDEMSDKR